MIIKLDDILYLGKDEITVKDTIDTSKIDLSNSEIIALKDVYFDGKIGKDQDILTISGNLSGTMTISDSISLEDVDYDFEISIDEGLEDLKNNQNTIDILDILWQNIVLEVPLRYTLVTDYNDYSGDGWKLISEEEDRNKNNPFRDLTLINTEKE